MEEAEQEASLGLYKEQLSQVNQAIELTGETADLTQLKNDLTELITLTEENLLQLKKARLLQSLEAVSEDVDEVVDQAVTPSHAEDDEWAAFQASISGQTPADPKPPKSSSPSASPHIPTSSNTKHNQDLSKDEDNLSNDSSSSSSDDDDYDDDNYDPDSSLTHLIGTKCQAPIKNDWGGHHYGNAMIWSIDTPSEEQLSSEYMVRVIFLNPTQPSMVPCSYFMDGSCRFSEGTCRRSHGQAVLVSELKPFMEPDHSKISEGCRCLAKSGDDVWYPGVVTDVCDDHQVNVKFDAGGSESTVLVEHIKPIEEGDTSDESEDDTDERGESSHSSKKTEMMNKGGDDEDDEDDGLPTYLWKPSGTTDRLGAWEDHTKGVGSRLMAKMGYITGQGLGPKGDGRAEPVPIMLLPQGKSLDKIMELKEMAGNADLFNAMKKIEKRQKVLEKKAAEREKKQEAKSNWGVFGFLNKKLHSQAADKNGSGPAHHHGHAHSSRNKKAVATPTSVKELGKRSDKDVNIQIFQTAEEIRAVERNLGHLRRQLARNESRDRKMAEQVSQKISEQESYLRQLKTSSQTLESHKQNRSAHKKLTIF